MTIMSGHAPDIENALSRALAKETPLGGPLVDENRDFEGYRWHDELPRLLSCSFVVQRDGVSHRYAEDVALPDEFESGPVEDIRSEEHTSELQSLMRISYAVFCLKKKKK